MKTPAADIARLIEAMIVDVKVVDGMEDLDDNVVRSLLYTLNLAKCCMYDAQSFMAKLQKFPAEAARIHVLIVEQGYADDRWIEILYSGENAEALTAAYQAYHFDEVAGGPCAFRIEVWQNGIKLEDQTLPVLPQHTADMVMGFPDLTPAELDIELAKVEQQKMAEVRLVLDEAMAYINSPERAAMRNDRDEWAEELD